MTPRLIARLLPFLILLPTAAEAHTGVSSTTGLAHGFAHPFGGLDHLLAMVAVGLYAVILGGRALYVLPLTFMAMMVAGGIAGMAGVSLPLVEAVILLSVIVFACAVAFRLTMPPLAAMALVGFFAIFHGYAHGTEMPVESLALAYGAGFVAATGLLHLFGIGLALLMQSRKKSHSTSHSR